MNIPEHIAMIMDGNGRWAKKRFLKRSYGHKEGAKALKIVTEHCQKIGVKYLTVYAFSTENWKRPEEEVKALMKLLNEYIDKFIEENDDTDLKVKVIGDKSALDIDLQKKIAHIEEISKDKTGICLSLAINYGGRDEIVRATKKMLVDIKDNDIKVDSITEEVFGNYLDTAKIPEPEILIRTSGEFRISNFLLWQIAYTEIFILNKLWPEIRAKDIDNVINEFNKRDRRFGE